MRSFATNKHIGIQLRRHQTISPPRMELSFIVLKSPNYTQQVKRTFMNNNFLLTITLSCFKEKIFLPFFLPVNLLNVKA